MKHKPVVIFDIDGTLADISHRRHFVEGKKKNWAKFNQAMINDTPKTAIVALYQALWDKYYVIIVSGRTDDFRPQTEAWFKQWNIPINEIHMRRFGDYRADNLIKEEILQQLQHKGYQIQFVVDDRDSVVAMWREHGITCLQCDYGDF